MYLPEPIFFSKGKVFPQPRVPSRQLFFSYFFGRTSEIARYPWESTKYPGPVKINKYCDIVFSMIRCYFGFFFQKKRKKAEKQKRKKTGNPYNILRSPLSQASTLALTEQVAPEQARCRIRVCVLSHTRNRIVKFSELNLPNLLFIVNSQHGWKMFHGFRKMIFYQI